MQIRLSRLLILNSLFGRFSFSADFFAHAVSRSERFRYAENDDEEIFRSVQFCSPYAETFVNLDFLRDGFADGRLRFCRFESFGRRFYSS